MFFESDSNGKSSNSSVAVGTGRRIDRRMDRRQNRRQRRRGRR